MNRLISNPLIVILFILAISVSSCPKNPVSSGSTSAGTLPADWPIPQLSFSTDVTLSLSPTKGSKSPEIDGMQWTFWCAYVHCDDGITGLAKHVESSLAPLKYQRVVNIVANKDLNKWKLYYSPDGKIEVSIIGDLTRGLKASKEEISDTEKKWHDDGAVALASVKDFMILINVYKSSPLPYMQLLQGSHGNDRLVPITAR